MKNRFKVFLSLTLIYAMLIFYLSSRSSLGDPRIILDFLDMESLKNMLNSLQHSNFRFLLYPLYILSEYPDKTAHLILYSGFGFLLYLTLKCSSNMALRNYAFILAFIIGIVYGASDELHQSFVPGRTASIWDILADGIGITMALAVTFINDRLCSIRKALSMRSNNKGNIIMKTIRIIPDLKNRVIYNLDLKLAAILVILSIIFILIPYFNQIFRIIFALAFLLLLPGYLLTSVIFPGRSELSSTERFTMSIGLSIAAVVFEGFALNYTRWGFRPGSIVISLSVTAGILLIIAHYQRKRLKEAGYSFSSEDLTSFYRTLISKETGIFPEYDPPLEKTIIRTMVLLMILVGAVVIYAIVTREPEKFTSLYIIGANGKAENYPTEIKIGEPATIMVGVENHEHKPASYMLAVKLGGKTLKEQYIELDHNNKWLNNVTFIPQITSSIAFAGANQSKLEILLLKENKPYRSVHLWVNTGLDSAKFGTLPNITNGDMESDDGWAFLGSPNVAGRYTNTASSRVYEINFTAEETESNGSIYENLTTHGDAPATLSFDVKDSVNSNNSYYASKQVLIDEHVIWDSGVGDKNSIWEHIEVPVLLSNNNTLTFRVYNKHSINYSITVWWDNIQLKPYEILKTNEILSQLGDVIEKNGLAVKLSGLSNTGASSLIKFSVENLGEKEKRFDLKPSPVLIDDLGNQYATVKIEKNDQIKQTIIYPGVIKRSTIFFKPINNSAKYLRLILYLDGEKYELGFKSEDGLRGSTSVKIAPNATMGEIINQDGLEVKLKGFQNTQNLLSQVIIAVKNMENEEEKPFNLNPTPILIDDLGNQYNMVNIERSDQIRQTTIYPGVIRRGVIFFKPINPNAKYLRLILYLNGEKYEFGFNAESKILEEEDLFGNASVKIAPNATMGETISQDGFEVRLKGFQNNQDIFSQIIIAVKNMENEEEKPFSLNPTPVLIDDLGNQYDMLKIYMNNQIRQTTIYPGVIRRGVIFFKPINPNAKYLRLIMYLNGEKYDFGFNAESKILEEDGLFGNASVQIVPNATMGETINQGGFEVRLKGFQNTQDLLSQVIISIKNMESKEKLFKLNSTPVLIDDLGNQYEMVDKKRSNQIEQTTIAPLAQIEGSIFFEPIKTEAKYIKLVLPFYSGEYIFGFETNPT